MDKCFGRILVVLWYVSYSLCINIVYATWDRFY